MFQVVSDSSIIRGYIISAIESSSECVSSARSFHSGMQLPGKPLTEIGIVPRNIFSWAPENYRIAVIRSVVRTLINCVAIGDMLWHVKPRVIRCCLR